MTAMPSRPWMRPEPLENASPDRPLCQKCGLFRFAKTPFMKPFIPEGYTHRALGVGEAPGKHEDEVSGRPFTGKAGELLDKKLKETGWSKKDVALHNATICRPQNNAEPTMTQIRCCRPFLLQVIRDLNPRFIIGFGTILSLIHI